MPSDTDAEALDAPDPLLRPAWEDTPDETDADLGRGPSAPARSQAVARGGAGHRGHDLTDLLTPLCDATDALARLDARAAAAPEEIREGLVARMAFAEAAGWLAHAHAWIHPLDLALRDLGLAGSTALTATGSGGKVLPHTFRHPGGGKDWDDPPFDAMARGDRIADDALALARALRRLPGGGGGKIFGTAIQATETLAQLGAAWLEPAAFTAWWTAHAKTPTPPERRRREGEGASPSLPPLLAAAQAAAGWMEAGISVHPAPHIALFAVAALLAHSGLARAVFLPVWAAYPAVGFGDGDALPTLRTDAATRLVGWGRLVTWPVAFLHLAGEGARAGLRELDRLEAAAAKGRGVVSGCDKRSRLPDALDALLRAPALTPKALAGRLKIARQTGTGLLRELAGRGVAQEVTGRGSFRAFAV